MYMPRERTDDRNSWALVCRLEWGITTAGDDRPYRHPPHGSTTVTSEYFTITIIKHFKYTHENICKPFGFLMADFTGL